MRVTVRLFAGYRERAGRSEMPLELPDGATVGGVAEEMLRRYPGLARDADALVLAVNDEYRDHLYTLNDGDEVALIPPVSGGAMVEITDSPLDPESLTARVRKSSSGAVVTFLGTTRDTTEDRRVLHLEYEAYRPMADKKIAEIVEELCRRWGVEDAAIAHRIGRLDIGEISLVVAVAAPHRNESFEACQRAVDLIKQTVPIWKKEFFEGGEVWIESPADTAARERARTAQRAE